MSTNSSVNIIEGFDAVKNYYYAINDLLKKDEEVLVFGARSGNPDYQDSIDFFINYIHDRSTKGIHTKILYNQDVQPLGKTYEMIPLVNVRYMPMGLVTKVGVNIYRDTIDMLDWEDFANPKVIVIQDQNIANSYREYFNMLWSATVAIKELEEKGRIWLPEILFEQFVRHTNEKSKVNQELVRIFSDHNMKSILNIGSGLDNASVLQKMLAPGTEVVLLEKNSSYVQAHDNALRIIQADFEQWEPDQKYDGMLISHVMYYFQNQEAAITKMINALNNSGVGLIVAHSPTGDYKRLKDLVFGFKGKKYTYTHTKIVELLNRLGCDFEEVRVDCQISADSVDELYRILRLWFEMDLGSYYQYEKEIKDLLQDKVINYQNSIFVVKKK